MPTVCIGGINADNIIPVLSQCRSPSKSLDGVAIVSAIMAASDPAAVSRDLVGKVAVAMIPQVLRRVAETTPLTHNMTNLVSVYQDSAIGVMRRLDEMLMLE